MKMMVIKNKYFLKLSISIVRLTKHVIPISAHNLEADDDEGPVNEPIHVDPEALFDFVNDDPDDDPDNDPHYDEEFNEVDDYNTILNHLSKEWLKIEVNHDVSKTGTDAFWVLAKTWFHRLFTSKTAQRIRRKTPSFTHIRKKFYNNHVPPVHMEIAFQHKESGALTIVEDTLTTPKTRFPPHEFHKLWEIAHVEVNLVSQFHICFHQVLIST